MRPHTTLIRQATIIAALLLPTALVEAQCPLDDSFEDNDDCASAVIAPLGLTSGLVVHGAASTLDRDFWIIQNVPDGHELIIDVLFAHANGNIDARLYSNSNCSGLVAVGSSSTSNENLAEINSTGATKDYYLMVLGSSAAFDCNNYDLDVMIVPDQSGRCVRAERHLCRSRSPRGFHESRAVRHRHGPGLLHLLGPRERSTGHRHALHDGWSGRSAVPLR